MDTNNIYNTKEVKAVKELNMITLTKYLRNRIVSLSNASTSLEEENAKLINKLKILRMGNDTAVMAKKVEINRARLSGIFIQLGELKFIMEEFGIDINKKKAEVKNNEMQ